MAVSERRFGLEIECGCEDIDSALNTINGAGIEMELDYDGTEYELRTPVLQGDMGFEQLAFIYRTILDNGGYVTRSDGAHVHHEALEYVGNHAMLARLIRSWVNLEPVIEKLVVPYRRGNYGSCPSIYKKGDGRVSKLRRRDYYHGRGALNINNVVGSRDDTRFIEDEGYTYCRFCEGSRNYCYCDEGPPTIEVRMHEGSLDIGIMRPWIEMCQLILDKVAQDGLTIKTCSRVDTLHSRLGLPKESVNALSEKARMVANPYSEYSRRFDAYREPREPYAW